MSGVKVVFVTVPDQPTGLELARTLVRERLAACVNILPGVRSIYSWEGSIEDDSELLLIIKTGAGSLEKLTQRVIELHPYDEPEVLSLPVDGGSRGYLDWVINETEGSP